MPFDATPISSPVIDRLRAVRNRVARPDGWCQHELYSGGRVCIAGAAGLGDPLFGHVMRYLKIALIGREIPEMVENHRIIRDWQDEDGRLQSEVVELCDRAIEIAIEDELVGR